MSGGSKNKITRLTRCKSMPMIDGENEDTTNQPKKNTHRKMTAKQNMLTRGYKYTGRRSLGYAKRKKSKNERERDIQDDMCEDEGYFPSTSSTTNSTYRCIPALERSSTNSNAFLPSMEDSPVHVVTPRLLYTSNWIDKPQSRQQLADEVLVDRTEQLQINDRGRLHREITQSLKKADKEKANQSSMTQRVTSCALFGETVRFIVDKKYTFENILWLVLKSYFSAHVSGRNTLVGKAEWSAEDEKIAKLRKTYTMVLDRIKDFRFERISRDDSEVHSLNRHIQFTNEYLESLRCAKGKVSRILDDYDRLVDLFPNQNALWKSVTDERGISERNMIESRMVSMRVWLNTLDDMTEKLRMLGDLFEISSDSDHWFRPLDQKNAVFSFDDVHSVFRAYVKKSLNLKGMRRVLERVESITEVTLIKCAILMQRPPTSYAAATASRGSSLPFEENMKNRYGELAEWRFYNALSKSLALPSLSNIFFFLLSIPMQMVVHWLKIRSESDPPNDCVLDELTFDAMISDSRDCVEEAVRVKKNYVAILQSMCSKCALPGYLYPLEYNKNLLEVFEKYVYYVNCWSNCDSVRREPAHLFVKLEKEWSSARNCAISVKNGLTSLCSTFCDMSKSLIRDLIENFTEDQVDELKSKLLIDDDLEDHIQITPYHEFMVSMNQLIREVKEREVRIFGFIRTALNDIFDASGYLLKNGTSIPQLLSLMEVDFCMIQLVMQPTSEESDCDLPLVMFIDKVSSDKANVENCLLTLADGKKPDDGCIVIVPDTQNTIRSEWKGRSVKVVIDEEIRICFTYLRDDLIMYIGEQKLRVELEKNYSNYFKCVAPSCSSNLLISSRIEELTESVLLPHLEKEQFVIELIMGKLNSHFIMEEERAITSLRFKLEKHFWIAFQIHRDVARVVSDSFIGNLGQKMVEIAIMLMEKWIKFLELRDPSPSPYLPTWASPGFTFLQFITEPKWMNAGVISDSYYDQLSIILEKLKMKLITSGDEKGLKVITPTHRMSRSTSSRTTHSSTDSNNRQSGQKQIDRLRALDEMREKKDREIYQFGRVIHEDNETRFKLETEMQQVPYSKAPFEYAELDEIASGTFGTVYRAIDLDSHRLIAIKVLRIDRNNSKTIESEVNIFRQLNNKYLVKYYGVEVLKNHVHIFMEYCSQGTLESICQGKMDLNMVRAYTNRLLRAVNYLHEHRIIHRDIKPANIFLDKETLIKLGDFGCSSRLTSSSTIFGEFGQTVGTASYMAPEIFSRGGEIDGGYRGYGRSVDIWSIGCTVVQMMTGTVPWDKNNMYQIAFLLCFHKAKPTYPEIASQRSDVRSFLDDCFVFEPDERPSASDLLQSTFANVNIESDDFINIPNYEPQISKESSNPGSFQIV